MIEPVTAVLDGAGAALFFTAFIYAVRSFQLTRNVSPYWLVMAIATFTATTWAAALTLEKLGVFPVFIDQMVPALLGSAATGFAIAAFILVTHRFRSSADHSRTRHAKIKPLPF